MSSNSEIELRALLALSLQGDSQAYAQFLERVAKMVRSYLANSGRKSCTPQQIEDLVQDVLMAIHEKKHTYRTDLPVLPWIFAIARYRLIDSIRARRREPQISAWADDLDEMTTDEQGKHNDVAHRLDAATLLQTLPEKQREILMLAKVEELPLQEISDRLKISLSAVKVTIHRAMAKLSKAQGGRHDDEK